MPYTTSCHCGAVSVEMQRRIKKLTRCNCSICRRYGALWAYQQRKAITVTADKGALKSYAWGKKSIEYFRCNNCGCITHYERTDRRPDGSDMSAVNMCNIIDPASIAAVPIRLLDGAGSWKVLREAAEPDLLGSPVEERRED
ncbi:GFA family protein [Roseibium sp.]|uniref:GFA family protein n=1 Tax=Roseibium sp. TaxID=1936156 RepID=UPI003B52A847